MTLGVRVRTWLLLLTRKICLTQLARARHPQPNSTNSTNSTRKNHCLFHPVTRRKAGLYRSEELFMFHFLALSCAVTITLTRSTTGRVRRGEVDIWCGNFIDSPHWYHFPSACPPRLLHSMTTGTRCLQEPMIVLTLLSLRLSLKKIYIDCQEIEKMCGVMRRLILQCCLFREIGRKKCVERDRIQGIW